MCLMTLINSLVIGFTNISGQGCEGVEAAYDSFLSGKPGRVVTTKGNNEMDMPYSYENLVKASGGCNVILTLDTTVQGCLENRLQEAITRYDVQNGAFGLVMNCKTGEILAMATLGNFDPNNYQTVADPAVSAELEELRAQYLACPEGSQAYENGKKAYQGTLKGLTDDNKIVITDEKGEEIEFPREQVAKTRLAVIF